MLGLVVLSVRKCGIYSSRRVLTDPWNPRTFKDCVQQREVPFHEEGGAVLGVLRGEGGEGVG